MRILLGSDHAGYEMKEALKPYFERRGVELVDVGPHAADSVDYPDFAEQVARGVAAGDSEFGVLVCGSGIGMAIAANKVPGVRASVITDPELARMFRLHNDGNVITLGGRYIPRELAEEILDAFLETDFEGGRHQNRIDKIGALERASE